MPIAILKKPFEKDHHCGDECGIWEEPHRTTLCIADGLGHGEEAEIAAKEAVAYVGAHLDDPLPSIFSGCSKAIRHTRGAAMGILVLDRITKHLTYAGIGNTRAIIYGSKTSNLSNNNGIVGGGYRRLSPETLPFPDNGMILLFTDGITELIDLSRYGDIVRNDVRLLAQKIMEDWSKDSDDAAIIIYKPVFTEKRSFSVCHEGVNTMEITDEVRDIFTELINTGIGRAAVSISEMLNTEIYLSIPNLKILNSKDLLTYVPGKGWNECVTVIQRFHGGLSGKGIVSFPVFKGKTLVNLILGDSMSDNENLNILEREAISEVGNMIINAVGCTIADMANEEIQSHLPEIRISDSIIDLNEEDANSIYIVGETNFFVKDTNIEGTIILVFSYGNFEKLIHKFIDGVQ